MYNFGVIWRQMYGSDHGNKMQPLKQLNHLKTRSFHQYFLMIHEYWPNIILVKWRSFMIMFDRQYFVAWSLPYIWQSSMTPNDNKVAPVTHIIWIYTALDCIWISEYYTEAASVRNLKADVQNGGPLKWCTRTFLVNQRPRSQLKLNRSGCISAPLRQKQTFVTFFFFFALSVILFQVD